MSNQIVNKIKAGDLELKEKVVSINRVVKTTKGGRAFSFSALVGVGNEAGIVGHGLGKAKDVQEAITKGIEDAKKNLIKVPIMHGTCRVYTSVNLLAGCSHSTPEFKYNYGKKIS